MIGVENEKQVQRFGSYWIDLVRLSRYREQHLQEILVTAMKAETLDAYARMFNDNAVNFVAIRNNYPDVKIKTFAPEILAAMKEVNDQLLEEAAAKNEQFREILDSQRDYQAKARAWTVVSDYAYVKDNQGE